MRSLAVGIFANVTRLAHERRGVSAVEFALILPLMLLIYLGGFQLCQALSAYRKMTITTRTVLDLATQLATPTSPTVTNAQLTTVLNASAQIMAPFPTANLSIVLTELTTTTSATKATVTWSRALNGTPMAAGASFTVPANVMQMNSSILLAQVSYSYTPPVAYKLTGPYTMSDGLYMVPRQVSSIPAPTS